MVATHRQPDRHCVYCKAACDGTLRDVYGEFVLRRDLPVCASCENDLADEPGPWTEWGD